MNLELHNSWNRERDDWWSWTAYLTGSDLANVDFVEYVLHPTFPDPVVKVKDSENGFKLRSSGWGTFDLKAIVHLKDGGKTVLTHELKLLSQPNTGHTGP